MFLILLFISLISCIKHICIDTATAQCANFCSSDHNATYCLMCITHTHRAHNILVNGVECCQYLFSDNICNHTSFNNKLMANECLGTFNSLTCFGCNGCYHSMPSVVCHGEVRFCGSSSICCSSGKQALCQCNDKAQCECI